jgi:hypothetical protein
VAREDTNHGVEEHTFDTSLFKVLKTLYKQLLEMQKCKHYPNCDCYNDWEEPAKRFNPENADVFVTVMQEIRNFLDNSNALDYQLVFERVKDKLQILPLDLHSLMLGKLLPFIEFHYLWKMPEKSDLIKLKKAFIKTAFPKPRNGILYE